MEKKQYISPSMKVRRITIKSRLLAGSEQSVGFGNTIGSNETQGTDFEVESKGRGFGWSDGQDDNQEN